MLIFCPQGAASVADLSTWLQEISMGEKHLEDYKKNRGRRDDGKLETPRQHRLDQGAETDDVDNDVLDDNDVDGDGDEKRSDDEE